MIKTRKSKLLIIVITIIFIFTACDNGINELTLNAGLTPDNPITRVESIHLGNMADANSGWRQLLAEIEAAGQYVALDLSAATMNGTVFYPDPTVETGKRFIVSLVLPGAAASIVRANQIFGTDPNTGSSTVTLKQTFRYFIELKEVTGRNIISIGLWAFRNIPLISISFPAVECIAGAFQFTNLTNIYIPAVRIIDSFSFAGSNSLTSITLGSTPPFILGPIFFNSGTAPRTITFYVPCIDTYITAGTPWSDMMGPWNSSIGNFWDS